MASSKSSSPYEARTKLSLILAVIGGLSMLVLLAGVFHRYDFNEFAAPYKKNSIRFFGIIGAFLLACLSGGAGFFLSLNAAGQKRNTKSALAWRTFFMHAVIITISLCVMILFYFTRYEIIDSLEGK